MKEEKLFNTYEKLMMLSEPQNDRLKFELSFMLHEKLSMQYEV